MAGLSCVRNSEDTVYGKHCNKVCHCRLALCFPFPPSSFFPTSSFPARVGSQGHRRFLKASASSEAASGKLCERVDRVSANARRDFHFFLAMALALARGGHGGGKPPGRGSRQP